MIKGILNQNLRQYRWGGCSLNKIKILELRKTRAKSRELALARLNSPAYLKINMYAATAEWRICIGCLWLLLVYSGREATLCRMIATTRDEPACKLLAVEAGVRSIIGYPINRKLTGCETRTLDVVDFSTRRSYGWQPALLEPEWLDLWSKVCWNHSRNATCSPIALL